MSELSELSKTLFVPMGGRIFASERFPKIFYDKKALELKRKIPREILDDRRQSEYTFLASATRSRNVDTVIRMFLSKHKKANIVELGCGLETSYFRCDNGSANWIELDLSDVIEFRRSLLPDEKRMCCLSESILSEDIAERIAEKLKNEPTLFLASGLFHYFERDKIIALLRRLSKIPNAGIVFDAVNSLGIKGIKKYMKQLGRESAKMYFFCNDEKALAGEISSRAELIFSKPFYRNIDKRGMKLITRLSMRISDMFNMVKLIYIKLS